MSKEKEIEESLSIDDAIDEGLSSLRELEVGSEEYRRAAEAIAKLSATRIEDYKAAMEHEEKIERRKMDEKAHKDELELQSKQECREWVKVGVGLLAFVVGEIIFVTLDTKCLQLEEFGTLNTKIGSDLRKEVRKPLLKL